MKSLLLKTAISVALIVAVLHFNNIEGVMAKMLDADPLLLGLAVAISIATSLIHACRWILVIKAVGDTMSYARAARVVLIGYFFNHFLPTSLGGDVYRIWHTHRGGTSLAAATNAVILDRIVALVALLLMMLVSLPWLFRLIADPAMRWGLIMVIGGGFFGVAILVWSTRLAASLRHLKAISLLVNLSVHARAVFLRPRYCVPAIALSIVMHSIFAVVVFITATALHLHVGIVSCLLLVPAVILITMLPFSVAGWGLREGAIVVAFSFVNVGSADAFTLSVMAGIVVMVASLPGASLWLFPSCFPGERSPDINMGHECVED